MLGGDNCNPLLPAFLDENRIPYQANASNRLQLFGSCEFSSACLSTLIFRIFSHHDSFYCLLFIIILLFVSIMYYFVDYVGHNVVFVHGAPLLL